MKTERRAIFLPTELHERVRKLAKKQKRTMVALIETLIEKHEGTSGGTS